MGKHEGRRQLQRPRHGWEDNIEMDLKELGWRVTDLVDLAQDRDRWQAVVNAVSGSIKCEEFQL